MWNKTASFLEQGWTAFSHYIRWGPPQLYGVHLRVNETLFSSNPVNIQEHHLLAAIGFITTKQVARKRFKPLEHLQCTCCHRNLLRFSNQNVRVYFRIWTCGIPVFLLLNPVLQHRNGSETITRIRHGAIIFCVQQVATVVQFSWNGVVRSCRSNDIIPN